MLCYHLSPDTLIVLLCTDYLLSTQYDGKSFRLKPLSLPKQWPLLNLGPWLSITGKKDDGGDTYLRQHPEIDPPKHIAVIMVMHPISDLCYESVFQALNCCIRITLPKGWKSAIWCSEAWKFSQSKLAALLCKIWIAAFGYHRVPQVAL